MKLSIVIPIWNEQENIPLLLARLSEVLGRNRLDYEIIAVNDGSSDQSWPVLKSAALADRRIKAISFRRNFGQTAALSAGLAHAQGGIIVPLDADLENDPADIPQLLKKIEEGFDVVSGWRQNRWPSQVLTRRIPSLLANWLISAITGLKLHDYGCTLKAYKRDLIEDIKLYGEMHRFIPALAAWQHAKVAELPVRYVPRQYGESAYGLSRTYRVILDLVLIKFLSRYMNRPMHFFGGLGFITFIMGLLAGLASIVLKLLELRDFVETPLPVWSALFIIVGVQLIAMGILAEMIMRTYYEAQGKTSYTIEEKVNL